MTKRNKRTIARFIVPVAIAALLAVLGYRAVHRWKPAVFNHSQRPTPRQSAERFRSRLLAGSDSCFMAVSLTGDTISRLAIADSRGRSFVLTNLSLLRQARADGLDLLSATEDRRRQSLELVYGVPGRPLLAILIRRKHRSPADSAAAKPRIALVAYRASDAGKSARAALARRSEIKTLVIDRPGSAAGRELLISLPLEPIGYPKEDPGPGTIRLDDSDAKVADKLARRRATVPNPVGFSADAGSRALKDKRIAALVAQFCADNRMVFLEPRFTANSLAREQSGASGCPYLTATAYIENRASVKSASAQIQSAFRHARSNKTALIMFPARTDILDALGKALTREVLAEFEFVGASRLGSK